MFLFEYRPLLLRYPRIGPTGRSRQLKVGRLSEAYRRAPALIRIPPSPGLHHNRASLGVATTTRIRPLCTGSVPRAPRFGRNRAFRRTQSETYDNVLAETIIGLDKTDLVHLRGPWSKMERR